MPWWHAVLDRGLELLGGRAPTARDALYLLDVLAVQVLALEAQVHPALVAAVGCFLFGGWVRWCARIAMGHLECTLLMVKALRVLSWSAHLGGRVYALTRSLAHCVDKCYSNR